MKYEKPIMNISMFEAEYIRQTGGNAGVPLTSVTPTNLDNAVIDANERIAQSNQINKALTIIQFTIE